jgi:hypothetical protein
MENEEGTNDDHGKSYTSGISTTNTNEEKQAIVTGHSDPNKAKQQQDRAQSNTMRTEEEKDGLDYEMHYGVSQRSVKDVLKEILDDIATQTSLHDWDKKLVITPFKKLETIIRSYLAKCSQEMLNDLLIHSSVEEIVNTEGKLQSIPAMQQNGQVKSHFFFSEVSPSMIKITELA